jgi:hypothetical protein
MTEQVQQNAAGSLGVSLNSSLLFIPQELGTKGVEERASKWRWSVSRPLRSTAYPVQRMRGNDIIQRNRIQAFLYNGIAVP